MAASIKDQVVIVTGASSGIGVAIAEKLAEAGAKVVIAARRLDRLHAVKKRIDDAGGHCIAVKCDVTQRNEVKELVKQTEATYGPTDVLINNAGVVYYTLMKNAYEDQWDDMINVNIKGVLNCTAAVLPGMTQRGKGHVVFISSDAGRLPIPGLSVYDGTKHFIEGLAQSMRIELVDNGVKVTSIQPGSVVSEIGGGSSDQEALAKYNVYANDADILKEVDVANAVLYAIQQPQYCAINEILLQPRNQPRKV